MWVWIIVDIQFCKVELLWCRFYVFWWILLRTFFHICCLDFFKKLHENVRLFHFLRMFGRYCILIFIKNFQRLLSSLDINEHFIFEILNFGLWIFVKSFLFESLLTLLNQDIFILINTYNKLRRPLCNGSAHLAPLLLSKLKYSQKLTVIKVPNRWFHCISILNPKTFEHWGSGSFFLFFNQVKGATMISKGIWDFLDQFGQNSALAIVRFRNVVDRTVKESIFLSWVSMKVQEKLYLMIFVDFFGKLFYQAYLRVQGRIRVDILTV